MLKILCVNTSELCNEREEYLSHLHHKKDYIIVNRCLLSVSTLFEKGSKE